MVFKVETALGIIAPKKVGKGYRRVLEVAERFMVRRHEDEAKLTMKRHASVLGGVQGDMEGGGIIRRETAVNESRR